jgi:1-deoxy-D-xylulose-5-phosphate reductoisomerase
VAAFLDGRIRWISIPDVLESVLERHDGGAAGSVDDVVDADRRAREAARSVIAERFSE